MDALDRFAALHAATISTIRDPIDLSYPNPRVHRDERAWHALRNTANRLTQDDYQYTPFGGGTVVRRKLAASLAARFGVSYRFHDVFLTPGATGALCVVFAGLFQPGDEVLMLVPGWMDYPLYLESRDVRVVPVPLSEHMRLDVEAVADAIGPRTAGVILSQPGCPTGVLHGGAELAELAAVLSSASAQAGRPIILVSDEAHRDTVWDDSRSPLRSPAEFYCNTVCVYSFGKAWSLQGQRTGYATLHPGFLGHEKATTNVRRALRSTGLCAPTTLMQRAVAEIADLVPDPGRLRDDQIAFRELLGHAGYEPIPGQATSFVYVRCPRARSDWEFVEVLASHGVLAMPSAVFHSSGAFRLALNEPRERFGAIADRLTVALQS